MEIDVEQIMKEIRESIMEEEDWEELPAFESVPIRTKAGTGSAPTSDASPGESAREVGAMSRTYEKINAWPLSQNPMKRFVQKAAKKTVRSLVPIIEYQNEFNSLTVRTMDWTKGHIDGLNNRAASMKQKASSMKQRVTGFPGKLGN